MLKAVKAFTYCTRRLLPGDTFEVKRSNDAKVLVAIRKAVEVRAPVDLPPPPPGLAQRVAASLAADQAAAGDELKALRDEYRAAVGRAPFNGWTAEQLRQRIAEARAGA